MDKTLEALMRRPEGVVTERFGCPMRERIYADGAWSASTSDKPSNLCYLAQMPLDEPAEKPVANPIRLVVYLNRQ